MIAGERKKVNKVREMGSNIENYELLFVERGRHFHFMMCLPSFIDDRPRIAEVCSVLTNAELLSLKSELTICKNQSVECMCIAEVLEESETKHELWIGSGESGSNSQLSWVTLGSRREVRVT